MTTDGLFYEWIHQTKYALIKSLTFYAGVKLNKVIWIRDNIFISIFNFFEAKSSEQSFAWVEIILHTKKNKLKFTAICQYHKQSSILQTTQFNLSITSFSELLIKCAIISPLKRERDVWKKLIHTCTSIKLGKNYFSSLKGVGCITFSHACFS